MDCQDRVKRIVPTSPIWRTPRTSSRATSPRGNLRTVGRPDIDLGGSDYPGPQVLDVEALRFGPSFMIKCPWASGRCRPLRGHDQDNGNVGGSWLKATSFTVDPERAASMREATQRDWERYLTSAGVGGTVGSAMCRSASRSCDPATPRCSGISKHPSAVRISPRSVRLAVSRRAPGPGRGWPTASNTVLVDEVLLAGLRVPPVGLAPQHERDTYSGGNAEMTTLCCYA